jgi:UDP-glucose 4-epimerase
LRSTVIITGGSGFIGSHLVARLGANGYRVLAASVSGGPRRESGAAALVEIRESICEARASGHDVAIVHLGAGAHVFAGRKATREMERALATTTALAEAAALASVRRLVFVSSIAADPGANEIDSLGGSRPSRTAYGEMKRQSEASLRRVLAGSPTSLLILRFPMVLGPGMRGNPLRLVAAISRGIPLPLAAEGNRRSVLSVANAACALMAAIESPVASDAPIYVFDEEPVSTAELASGLAEGLGRPARQFFVGALTRRLVMGLAAIAGSVSGIEGLTNALTGLWGSLVLRHQPGSARLEYTAVTAPLQCAIESGAWYRASRGTAP